MLKYLSGILIIQAATVAMTLAVIKSADQELWLAVLLLALIIGLVTAFWFASIASHAKKDALAHAKDEFSKERENLRVNAERQKTRLIRKSHEEIRKETNRAHARSSFKLGAGFIGIVAAGSLMIFSQLITLGLLTLAVGGGALGGYLMRVRQEVVSRQKKRFLPFVMEENLLLRFSLLRVIPAKFTSSTEQHRPLVLNCTEKLAKNGQYLHSSLSHQEVLCGCPFLLCFYTNMPVSKLHKLIGMVFLLLSASVIATPVIAETVRVPIKLDYPVLRQLMLSQLFNTPDKSVEILHDASGCSNIFLSDPQLGKYQQKLEITTHVRASIATAVFGNCTHLFNWEGDARFLTEPVILPGARSVRLNILSTQLYNPQGQLVTGQLWDLASGQLQPLMSRYQIDLSPTIDQLNTLLQDILSKRSVAQIKKITDSLRLAAISVATDGIDVAVKFQIDRLPATPEPVAILSAEEIQRLEAKWQMMDAMVTFAVKRYAKATHQQDLRDTLAEILLDARFRMRDALVMPVTRVNDPVRHWFIDSWQRLGPVLRQINLENPGQEPMLLISLLTATDVLETLDRMGPAIGLDISANGLRRMGRMLIDQPGMNPLRYDDAVDPELRHLFQLPAFPVSNEPSGFKFDFWPIRSAWAKSSNDRLKLWVPRKSELPEYLSMVRALLNDSANSTIEKTQLDASVKKIFQYLVLTTAWQESCWRQYEIKNRKIVTLRSSTGDSGLMQMNERVWRGLYDTQKLRWDIAYNVRAGTEVLHRYLVNYTLKRGEQAHPGGLDNLARSAYSAYNGGPSKTSRYRDPQAPSAHKKIDAAFWKKYQVVKQGKELQVAQCLDGETSAVVASPTNKPAPKKVRSEPDKRPSAVSISSNDDKAWSLAQNKNHYTLQLAAFSSYKAAQTFTTDNHLTGTVAIAPLGKDKPGQFVVLNGSFEKKAEADKLKQQYRKLKPWVRQFKDIQASIKR